MNGLEVITRTALNLLWPIAIGILLAGALQIAVIVFMKRQGYRRATINLVSYLVWASGLMALYVGWGSYVVNMTAGH